MPPSVALSPEALVALLTPVDAEEQLATLSGRPLLVVDLDGAGRLDEVLVERLAHLPCVKVGVGTGDVDPALLAACDVLLTDDTDAGTWIGRVPVGDVDAELAHLGEMIGAQPLAALTAVTELRLTEVLPPWEGVAAEAAAYAMLLGSDAFLDWRRSTEPKPKPAKDDAVIATRDGTTLFVELNRPEARNAVDLSLRDQLVAALQLAESDPGVEQVALSGRGQSFSAGGDLHEFGTVRNPATATAVRLTRHPGWWVHRCRAKVTAYVHGAAMGSGIEIPAFAHHVVATSDAFFGLPEMRYGLIPGAGGTVSVTKRIGRQRTAWLVLSDRQIDATTARAWGLVDEVVDELPAAAHPA
jgi:enoyl-CoA hydratase/carnithine racemase